MIRIFVAMLLSTGCGGAKRDTSVADDDAGVAHDSGADADADSDSDSSSDGDEVPEICDELADAVRAPMRDCCDADQMEEDSRAGALDDWCAEKHALESTDIDPTLERECVEAMRASFGDCRFPWILADHPCSTMHVGLVALDGACVLDVECVEDLLCAFIVFDGFDYTGACVAPPARGDPCVGARCGEGLFCDREVDSLDGTCLVRIARGEDCSAFDARSAPCEDGSVCDGARCVPAPAPGLPDGSACETDLDCMAGCCDSGTCGRSLCDPFAC